mmetsp:Transcript_22036/g.31655  ORF Transcript_22036/g.31655 Transcript_22036/m.31655 type:complete len:257 (+) Transcript_22036:1471-2241(+)
MVKNMRVSKSVTDSLIRCVLLTIYAAGIIGILYKLSIIVIAYKLSQVEVTSRKTLTTSNTKSLRTNTKEKYAPPSTYTAGSMKGLESDLDVKIISTEYFDSLLASAYAHPRKRKMYDLTKNPEKNSMQSLMNVWTNGSFSPVHKHPDFSEAFVVLKGALAFFTFSEQGRATCTVLSPSATPSIIVEKGVWHAMTAAPPELGWPGHAIIFEMSGHLFTPHMTTKVLAPFAPEAGDPLNGDPGYFATILKLCPLARQG